jgi:hypothetical protein
MRSIRSLFPRRLPAFEESIKENVIPDPDPSRYLPEGESDLDRMKAEYERAHGVEPGPFKPNLSIVHLDGVTWWDAPVPPSKHACWAQTLGNLKPLETIRRCACGSLSYDGQYWMDRNTRSEKADQ